MRAVKQASLNFIGVSLSPNDGHLAVTAQPFCNVFLLAPFCWRFAAAYFPVR
jgi:hypothetical protein